MILVRGLICGRMRSADFNCCTTGSDWVIFRVVHAFPMRLSYALICTTPYREGPVRRVTFYSIHSSSRTFLQESIMKPSIKAIFLATAICGLFPAQAVLADTIQLNNFWSSNGSATITFNGTNYHNGAPASFTETGSAGGFRTYNLTTDPGMLNSFQSWCLDIFHSFGFPVTSTNVFATAASIFGGAKATDLGRLYTNQHALIDSTASTANNSAAFQLAVWEIVSEQEGSPYNLGSGNLQVTSGSTGYATAQTWLAQLNSTPSVSQFDANVWSVTSNTGPFGAGAQDVGVFTPVPEPGTYAMMLAGLGLLGFAARRRQKR